ncbi:MAG TPA: cell wall hydrolase, partial [Verrucomicrobiae bacterium]|nr:cell wall hydrolase [Verrucomicrobiae bacterium]
HPDFPNTIKGVIYQPGAFTAVDDGQINLAPNQTAYNAVRDAINGWDPSKGALYYWNPVTAQSKWVWSRPITTQIGNHVFAK